MAFYNTSKGSNARNSQSMEGRVGLVSRSRRRSVDGRKKKRLLDCWKETCVLGQTLLQPPMRVVMEAPHRGVYSSNNGEVLCTRVPADPVLSECCFGRLGHGVGTAVEYGFNGHQRISRKTIERTRKIVIHAHPTRQLHILTSRITSRLLTTEIFI